MPEVAGETFLSLPGQKGQKGLKSPPRPPPPPPPALPDPAAKHEAPETFSPQLPNICSPWPARKNISSKG